MTKKNKLKRLILDIYPDLHWQIKQLAHDRNMSMKKYVLQALQIKMKQDEGL